VHHAEAVRLHRLDDPLARRRGRTLSPEVELLREVAEKLTEEEKKPRR
jgi:hypothetical protein